MFFAQVHVNGHHVIDGQHLQEALEATASLTLEDQRWIYSGTAHALYPDLNKA